VSLTDKSVRKLNGDNENREKEGLEWHPGSQFLTYMFYGPERSGAQIRRAYVDGRPTDVMIDQPDHWDYLGLWAPDGRRYFFTTAPKPGEKVIHLYNSETGQITHGIWDGGVKALPRWSRDGSVAVWAIGNTRRYFEVIENFR
jgi:Tol biopolymer transport system component